MAWNRPDLGTPKVPVGGSRALEFSYVGNSGHGYKVNWDVEKAIAKGMENVTWVYRCIDVIASSSARLPIIFREDNNPHGAVVDPVDERNISLHDVLNKQSNVGENALTFRSRVMGQLLVSKRGVFIEKVRARSGKILSLSLLPPEHTAPIPDPKKFVKGYEVDLHDHKGLRLKKKRMLPPEDVLWIRNPDPINPYSSKTPLQAAGVAVDIEGLAKLYNRNFLLNDGRPGGLLIFKNPTSEEDRREMESRFSGEVSKAGAVSVLEASEGVDFVDLSMNPRDAAYIQMRGMTKEEILAAFGVPESIIGNSASRSYSNAAVEGEFFWQETMVPYLAILSSAFDTLSEEYYVDHDTSEVPVLIMARHERQKFALAQYNTGAISMNEFREGTERPLIDSEMADLVTTQPGNAVVGSTRGPLPSEQEATEQAQGLDPASPEADPATVSVGGVDLEAGVDMMEQSQGAASERVIDYDPSTGQYGPTGALQGVRDIALPASKVPSEKVKKAKNSTIEDNSGPPGQKSLPLHEGMVIGERPAAG